MLVRKHVVSPGRYFYMTDQGVPACLDATPERIKKWHDNGNAMIAAGLSIPVPIEHKRPGETGCGPVKQSEIAAERLKNNAGWAQKFEMDGNAMYSVLDIKDPSIAEKLPHTIKWTSPWIASFVDGDGKHWDEAPLHIALTTHPRITKQQPFPNVSAAMSYAASAANTMPQGGISLSRAGLLNKFGAEFKPAYPKAFSLWSGAMLSEEEMKPKEKPKEAPPKAEVEPKVEAKPEGEAPAPQLDENGQPIPESLVDADGDISVEEVISDLLSIIGIEMAEGTTAENFREHLYRALMDKHKADNTPEPIPEVPTPETPKPPKAPIVEESQPMYMSVEQLQQAIAAETNASTKAIMSAMLSFQTANQAKAAALEKNAYATARASLKARIDGICKKAKNDAVTKNLTAALEGAQFSIGEDGTVKDSLTPWLDTFEPAIRDMPVLLSMGVQVSELAHPQEMDPNGMSPEKAKELADQQCKRHNVGAA